MRALITAGGQGTRLRPITFTSNKHLIPVANKPMLFYALEAVAEAGIKEVGIIINETKPEIEAVVGRGRKWGFKVTYIFQEKPLGLAHCIKVAQKFLGKEPFVFYLGDNILAGSIKRFVESFVKKKPNAQMLLAKVADPSRFGVPIIKRGKVVGAIEKPKRPKTNYAITGIYLFDQHVFECFSGKDAIKPSERGELEITDVFQYLINHGFRVTTSDVSGWWKDTGKMEALLDANRLVLDRFNGLEIDGKVDKKSQIVGDVRVEKGSKITNTVIRGPVVIGQNVYIKNSYIGPYTSIYHHCQVINSELENSILLEGAKLVNLDRRVDTSLIGKDARVVKTDARPRAYNFLIGDTCQVDLI